jgi:two-component system sensor histidine kinase KdpD
MQQLGRELSTAADLGQVLQAGRRALERALDAQAWLRVGEQVEAAPTAALGDTDHAAAAWTQRHGAPSGRHTDTLAGAGWWFVPMTAGEKTTIGVAGLRMDDPSPPGLERRRLAEAMVEDIAQAALRTRLVGDLEKARMSGETERLRSALLSSVSHDLRSPLAAMIGSASSLSGYGQAMPV